MLTPLETTTLSRSDWKSTRGRIRGPILKNIYSVYSVLMISLDVKWLSYILISWLEIQQQPLVDSLNTQLFRHSVISNVNIVERTKNTLLKYSLFCSLTQKLHDIKFEFQPWILKIKLTCNSPSFSEENGMMCLGKLLCLHLKYFGIRLCVNIDSREKVGNYLVHLIAWAW